MYITDTTENVRKFFDNLLNEDDISKMRFLLYIFDLLNNNQINSINEGNPDLKEDDDLIVFNLDLLGLNNNCCTTFLQYNAMIYNTMSKTNKVYEDNGNVIGIEYETKDKNNISIFEKFSFFEKLDVFSEIFIRYDNDTYFKNDIVSMAFSDSVNGYDIAKLISDYKIRLKK